MSVEEIKAEVCWRLRRRNCWGARYLPVDSLVDWLGRLVKKDGKRVQASVDELIREGLLLPHKKGRTVSLNPHRIREIEALLEEHL
jgi:hypothetical protein